MEDKIQLNEKLIHELSFDKSKSAFDKLLITAIIGRNLALVYMAISFGVAYTVQTDLILTVLVIFGGLAMLFSFYQHLSLKRPDFDKMSTVELLKTISKFRIHIAKLRKYDIAIVAFWLATLLPIWLRYMLKIQISPVTLILSIISVVGITLLFSKGVYQKWDEKLRENEDLLKKTIEFENS